MSQTRLVNLQSVGIIMSITPAISGVVKGIRLTTGEIRSCLVEGVKVEEILEGVKDPVRLDLSNYKNPVVLAAPAVEIKSEKNNKKAEEAAKKAKKLAEEEAAAEAKRLADIEEEANRIAAEQQLADEIEAKRLADIEDLADKIAAEQVAAIDTTEVVETPTVEESHDLSDVEV
jgi:hypothetical protein